MKRAFALLLASCAPLAILVPRPASAISMNVTVLPHHQVGTGGAFTLGHFIDANTWASNLTVSGSFRVSCQDANITPLSESYSATQTVVLQQNVLSMGVPRTLPAQRSLPGWARVVPGTTVWCTDDWAARATEGGITIGTGGATIPVGFGERSQTGTVEFQMIKTGTFPGPGCIP